MKGIKPEWDLCGRGAIADALEVSTRTVTAWAKDERDPMPVHVVRGRVYASTAELRAWVERQDESAA